MVQSAHYGWREGELWMIRISENVIILNVMTVLPWSSLRQGFCPWCRIEENPLLNLEYLLYSSLPIHLGERRVRFKSSQMQKRTDLESSTFQGSALTSVLLDKKNGVAASSFPATFLHI